MGAKEEREMIFLPDYRRERLRDASKRRSTDSITLQIEKENPIKGNDRRRIRCGAPGKSVIDHSPGRHGGIPIVQDFKPIAAVHERSQFEAGIGQEVLSLSKRAEPGGGDDEEGEAR